MNSHYTLRFIVAISLFGAVDLCARGEETPKYKDPKAPVEERVSDLLSRMTLEEEIDMIAGLGKGFGAGDTVPNARLGIPQIDMVDGRMGIHGGGKPSTCYPGGIALAASWDRDLATEFGRQLARDSHARGAHIWLGPMMDIYRIPVGGRNFECAGEDPYLVSQISVSQVKAIQAGGVMATAVIFCCNDQDFGHKPGLTRFTANSIVDDRTLNEIYYPPFKALAEDAQVGAFMASYNLLNGLHCTQNSALLNGVLKHDWGFNGFVMSDWGATHDAVGAANGGLDIEMPRGEHFNRKSLLPAVQNGLVKKEVIDDKVRRMLREFFTFGFFDHPQKDESIPMDDPQSDALSLKMAHQEMVLLKNENNILPLDRSKIHSIAVLGPNAYPAVWTAGGSSFVAPWRKVGVLEGIQDVAGSGINVTTVPWHEYPPQPGMKGEVRSVSDLIADSARTAKESDVAILCIGFNAIRDTYPAVKDLSAHEGEGDDRAYALPPGQVDLIKAVVAANPHTIVILNAGGSVEWTGWLDQVPALIHAWYPGQEGGRALADIIFGDVNPSGKLPATFEKKWEDSPASKYYDGVEGTNAVYGEGIFVGYRGFDQKGIEPQFPFGYGLSYTTFGYDNLKIDQAGDSENPKVTVHFDIKNTGSRAGAEIAEIYVGESHPSVPRPPKELKGFQRIELAPGETKSVSIDLDRAAFAYYDTDAKAWKITPGEFKILVGPSSRSIALQQVIKL
jgi:beta-glucosidase